MKNYIGAKIIQAEKGTIKDYKIKKYGKDAQINEGDDKIECYIIVYPPIGNDTKPYLSTSPPEIFEKAYRKVEDAEMSLLFSIDNSEENNNAETPEIKTHE